jgi:hypothetical protein
VDLYIHSPIRLHGVVLNSLGTGTNLPFTFYEGKVKDKVFLVQAVEALRLRLPHFQTFGSWMAARLSALRAGRFLPPGKFLVLISVRG